MEDTRLLKKIIDESDFPDDVKKALFECVILQLKNASTTEYIKSISNLNQGKNP